MVTEGGKLLAEYKRNHDACTEPSPDVNGDAMVDGNDLGRLLAAWTL